jgi:hypothetical protein
MKVDEDKGLREKRHPIDTCENYSEFTKWVPSSYCTVGG